MKKISREDFRKMVQETAVSEFVCITLDTDVKLNKTGNPFRDAVVQKTQTLSAGLGWDYDNAVRNRLVKEGMSPVSADNAWDSEGRTWGKRIDKKFVEHTSKAGEYNLYLTLYPQAVVGETVYHVGDKPVAEAEIKPFMPPKSASNKQDEAGVEKKICYRDVKLTSIKSIKMRGEEYEVVD